MWIVGYPLDSGLSQRVLNKKGFPYKSPEFKDALLIARAKKGTKHTPEEHTIISHALKHKKAQAHAARPAPFVIPPGIMKELTSIMQT